MTVRRLVAFGAVLGALALAPGAGAKGTAYSTGNSNELQSKPIAADGTLGAASVVPTGAVTPRGIAITPNGQYLYMTSAGANVLGFNITGTPSQVSGSPYNVTDTGGYGLAISPNGQFLFTLNQNGGAGSVSIFSINSNGSLTKQGANTALGYQGDGVAIAPGGSSLYITDTTNNTVHSYSIGANGAITQIGTPRAAGTNPKGIAISPNGAFVFTGATGGQINAFAVQADGSLAAATSTVNTGLSPQTLAVTQSGQFLYAADFNNPGRISAYSIAADGALSAVPGQPFAAVNFTYGIDAAPGSRFVYSTSFDAAADVPMDGYSVGVDGALAALTGSPFATAIFGSEFQSVVVTPNQGPSALFTGGVVATRQGGGQTAEFNASSSTDSDGGSVATYTWDFGDGSAPETTASPTISHTYAAPGDYQVTLTVTDDEGCSTQVIFTGQTADCNPSTVNPARMTQTVQVSSTGGTAPNLTLSAKKQELSKKVVVKAKTDDQADAVAKGKLKINPEKGDNKSFNLKKDEAELTGGEKEKLKLKVPDKAYNKAKKALKDKAKVTAKISVSVTDADDDTDKDSVKVKLTKP